MLEYGFAEFLYRDLPLSFKAQCLGVMVLHRHRAIIWGAFGVVWLNSRGGGVVESLMCFCTLMQFVSVCMQAMTHSVDNVPRQQAVRLVVAGLGFVEQFCLRLFLGDQLQ